MNGIENCQLPWSMLTVRQKETVVVFVDVIGRKHHFVEGER